MQGADLGFTEIQTAAHLCEMARAGELVNAMAMIDSGANILAQVVAIAAPTDTRVVVLISIALGEYVCRL